jgi:hypothetical protein
MEEQLIEFETAKLAKDKGFNEIPCHYVYDEGILKQSYQAFNRLNFELAPTQSLLQKWLREEHEIYLCPIWNTYNVDLMDMLGYKCKIFTWKKGEDMTKVFKTYEEALEKGLQEALKLITTQKEKG